MNKEILKNKNNMDISTIQDIFLIIMQGLVVTSCVLLVFAWVAMGIREGYFKWWN